MTGDRSSNYARLSRPDAIPVPDGNAEPITKRGVRQDKLI